MFAHNRSVPLVGANRKAGLRVLAACSVLALGHSPASARSVASVCSGVSLPRSVVTDIAGQVLVPVLTPVQNILSALTFGTVNLGLAGALANAAAGAPITLNAVDVGGNAIDILADPECVTQSDSFTLETAGGIAFGGNMLTGLGTNGRPASAGSGTAIAIGDSANTSFGAAGAIALGENASVTHVNTFGSVALGRNSVASGAALGDAAYLIGGAAVAEVNIGGRRLTGLAGGADDGDAVNVAQLRDVNGRVATTTTAITNLGDTVTTIDADLAELRGDALLFDTNAGLYDARRGGVARRVAGIADGTLSAGSSDAVNGAQLFATNGQVAINTIDIANLGNIVANFATGMNALAGDALLFDANLGAFNALHAGTASRVTNVADGALAAGSTDAVTGAQLFATDGRVTANTTNIVTLGDAVASLSTGITGLQADALLFDPNSGTYSALRGGVSRRVSGVADGTLTAASTDAVTGGQLFATNQAIGATTAVVNTLSISIANGSTGPVRYSSATSPTVPSAGPSQELTLVGAAAGPVGLHNVRAGAVAAASTDAVNGGQVFDFATSIASLIGGGSVFDQLTGTISAPSFMLNGTSYANVGDALESVAAAGVTYDGPARDRVTLAGAGGTVIDNVAAGTLAAGSAEAVNGSQLFATNAQVSANTAAITVLTNTVSGSAVSPVQYSDAATPTMPNGGTLTNDVTFVGADLTGPVRLHNVAAGSIAAGSTDAVNGGQIAAIVAAAGNSVQYDANADGSRANRVTLAGGAAGAVTLANVANGAVTASSTEAVNGGQLFGTSQVAQTALATANQAAALGRNAIQYDAGGQSATLGAPGSTAPVALRNVAPGVTTTDAVNMGQVSAGLNNVLSMSTGYTDSRIASLGFDLGRLRRDSEGGTAAAMAMSTIPQAYGPGMGTMGMGVSTWQGEHAIAIGFSKAAPNGKFMVKGSATYNTRGDGGAAVGGSFSF